MSVTCGPNHRFKVKPVNALGYLVCLLMLTVRVAAAAGANTPLEYVDEQTGVTVTVVSRPLVFARTHANDADGPAQPGSFTPRDYVTLAALAVDRSGSMSYWLIGYFWSAGVSQPQENARLASEPIVLQLQDRRIVLTPQTGSARDVGISKPMHPPPIGPSTASLYAVDVATMELIGESVRPVLFCGGESAPVQYHVFEDRLMALKELVRYLAERN
jgi:hypothetical protein